MHTVTVSISGTANDSISIDLGDAEALPVYVKLTEALSGVKIPKKTSRREAARVPTTPTSPTTEESDPESSGMTAQEVISGR